MDETAHFISRELKSSFILPPTLGFWFYYLESPPIRLGQSPAIVDEGRESRKKGKGKEKETKKEKEKAPIGCTLLAMV